MKNGNNIILPRLFCVARVVRIDRLNDSPAYFSLLRRSFCSYGVGRGSTSQFSFDSSYSTVSTCFSDVTALFPYRLI